jgi:hypothetical protein
VVRSRCAILVFVLLVLAPASAGRGDPPDSIVVLVSLDGWRWDYLDRVAAPNLQALASRGVRARALIPVFPTQTFPNHYTLVTGLYPEHHGIVANTFVDPAYPPRFTMSAPTARAAGPARCSGPAPRRPSAASGPRTGGPSMTATRTTIALTQYSAGSPCRRTGSPP